MRTKRFGILLVLGLTGVVAGFDLQPAPVARIPPAQVPPPSSEGPGRMPNADEEIPDAKKLKRIERVPIPEDMLELAFADLLANVPQGQWEVIRYVSIRDGQKASKRILDLILAHINRNEVFIPSELVVGSQGHLARVDLTYYTGSDDNLADWINLWESLLFDPDYSLLVTKDTLDLTGFPKDALPKTFITDVVKEDGKFIVKRREVAPFEKQDVIKLNPDHLHLQTLNQLQQLTNSLAPIVGDRYFKMRVFRSIKGEKVFKDLYGGLYYEFRGIKKAKDVLGKDTKATDLDLYFENLGIGNIKGGLSQEQLFDNLRSDQATAIKRSKVTGKPREGLMLQTPNGRFGGSFGAITGDIFDEDIDIGDHPLANLLKVRRRAREAIFPGPTGFPIFALFNADGSLQDEVPFQVAHDTTIPNPHTKRLESGMSCAICHGTDGSEGWKDIGNDARDLVGPKSALELLADRGQLKSSFNVNARLAGKYGGSFDKHIRRARDDLSEAYLSATGPWPIPNQIDIVKAATTRLQEEYHGYRYTQVTRRTALLEIGFNVPESMEADFIAWILPPDPLARVGDKVIEDWRIHEIKEGRPINRFDWALVYGFAQDRVRRRIQSDQNGELKQWMSRTIPDVP